MAEGYYAKKKREANEAAAAKKNKTGRHYNKGNQYAKKYIDKHEFETLCQIGCTQEEICAVFDVDHKTLDRWCHETYNDKKFSQVFREKTLVGNISLRRKQEKLAETSAAMAIFLGKNRLGQTDNPVPTDITPVEKRDPISQSLEELGKKL